MDSPFPLTRLPRELQDEIWIASLSQAPRVFHVARAERSESCPKHAQHLIFHNRPAPPIITQVSTRARDAVRVAGFIQFTQPAGGPGVWFNTRCDILYFGGSMTLLIPVFRTAAEDPPPLFTAVPGLHLVRHVGIPPGNSVGRHVRDDEGRSNFTVTVTYGANNPLERSLADLLRAFRKRAPAVKVIHFILPMIRDWDGSESKEVMDRPIVLQPLVSHTAVVRGSRRVSNVTWQQTEPLYLEALESLGPDTPRLTGWFLQRTHRLTDCLEELRRLHLKKGVAQFE